MEKLLGLCLTRDEILLIERNIGADFDLLKQTLIGCFVRVPMQGKPMLAAIKSIEDRRQIKWARFERRLFLPSLGYYEFGQVHPEKPDRAELEWWYEEREEMEYTPMIDELIGTKLTLLKMFLFSLEIGLATIETTAVQHEEINNIETQQAGSIIKNAIASAIDEHLLLENSSEEEIGEEKDDVFAMQPMPENEQVPDVQAKHKQKQQALVCLKTTAQEAARQEWNLHMARLSREAELPNISPIIVTSREVQLLVENLESDELNRVLTGCFVTVKSKKFVLELKKQPKISGVFVVPLMRILIWQIGQSDGTTDETAMLFLNQEIPICHPETGGQLTEIGIQSICSQKLDRHSTPVVLSLLAMRELYIQSYRIPFDSVKNIPWPRDEEIARKSTELSAALAKANERSHAAPSSLVAAPMTVSTSAANPPLSPAVVGTSNIGQQQQQNRRRQIATDAGETNEEFAKRRNDLPYK